jgi:hypothetical protein
MAGAEVDVDVDVDLGEESPLVGIGGRLKSVDNRLATAGWFSKPQ